jgi:hypothetical protein
MKYDILQSARMSELARLVNRKIEQKWEPIGGVAVVQITEEEAKKSENGSVIYIQAMKKKEQD